MIIIKSKSEIEKMRKAGNIVAKTHEELKKHIRPGITTKELDEIAEDTIKSLGGIPAFKGYGGFPASICTSINEEVVHGIPGLKKLKDGDIISIDIGAIYDGYYGDAAKTHPVGEVSDEAMKLIEVTKNSFYEGLKFCKEGFRLSDISHAVQEYVESNGFSIVRDYVGHGIGANMHEDPQIPNYGPPGKGPRLRSGMALAIEPMVNIGTYKVKTLKDNWTVVTLDGELSAHYEHTVIITEEEPLILT
ncbi:type I methionyl aminopeptidase [Paramaledivibacter caminithermalis]|jgi:methionyl aminopeptidase|uniref:Methionine aminopeptidase n=1 Tax=Paramaledivibacter caminithermalis (strain DSM 15212 / CIP 107654 / DViRD3) TaxID=1121301 RepID=A0A1M6RT99_PARC5|nr:type I methionyl aminopeptidase [Paramaledivibacter caminithermalis]SHK35673.1 methionine aminopeptidase, type I [Paramaledivibacter caminithermalis DSM 15212]